MGQFDKVRAKAIAAITTYGRLCRIIVVAEAAPIDESKPWNVGPGTPTYYPSEAGGMMAVSDVPMDKTDDGEPQKNAIVPGNVGVSPDRSMRFEIMDGEGAGVYAIDSFNTYAPDGLAIGWKLRLTTWPRQT